MARFVEQYLGADGVFAFVMPFATLSRGQFAGFRAETAGASTALRCMLPSIRRRTLRE